MIDLYWYNDIFTKINVSEFEFSNIPLLRSEVVEGKVEGYIYLYYPLFSDGFVVLNKEFSYVYRLINNKRSFEDIFVILQKKDKNLNRDEFVKFFDQLFSHHIIGSNQEKKLNFQKVSSKTPRLLRMWLHITNQCNFRCTYCFVNKTSKRMKLQDAIKWLKEVIDQAKKEGYGKIVINFGGGEPLFEWEKILKIVDFGTEYSFNLNIEIKFGVITNGSLITDAIAEDIKKRNMIVALSLDGLYQYQDLQRRLVNGEGSYGMVKKGIDCLLKNKTPFNVSTVITKNNVKHLPEFTRYLLKKDIPFIFGLYKDNLCSKYNMAANENEIIKFLKLAFKEIYRSPPKYTLLHGLLDNIVLDNPHPYSCRAGRDYLVLKHDGKIASCPLSIERKIGSIINNGEIFKTILRGSFLEPKNRTIDEVNVCRNCQWKYSCCGACPLMTKQFKGTYNTNSPSCRIYKILIPEMLRLEARRLIVQDNQKLA